MPKRKKYPDFGLVAILGILILLGVLVLASVSAPFSLERFGVPFYFLQRQLLLGLAPGLVLALLISRIPLELIKKWSPKIFLLNLIFLIMVFLPGLGIRAGGATRWVNLGFISFQPAEFLKLSFILYLASWLAQRTSSEKIKPYQQKKHLAQTLAAFIIIMGLISVCLIRQPNISTLGIIFATGGLMYFLAGTPLWHSFLVFFIGLLGLLGLIKFAPYRMARFLVFLNPEVDPMGIGYQLKQASIAIGSGGIFGLGLGTMSGQKFGLLPQTISDSIFAIFAEEAGFFGCLILISLFLLFFWRVFKISKNNPDKFSQLVGLGIGIWISLQSFVNIGAMIGVFPLTGIPLPFVSYGSSHLLAELMAVGILLNISKKTKL